MNIDEFESEMVERLAAFRVWVKTSGCYQEGLSNVSWTLLYLSWLIEAKHEEYALEDAAERRAEERHNETVMSMEGKL